VSGAAADQLGRLLLRLGDLAAACFAVAFVISVYEVGARYLFGAPTSWVHVSSTVLCVAAFALAGAYAAVRGEHMRVTVVFDRVRPRSQLAGRWLAVLCGLIYLAGLAWGAGREAISALWRFDSAGAWIPELTPGPPNWPLPALGKAVLLLGILCFALAVLREAWRLARRADDTAARSRP
jgi:TRAP-type C4-dicarboxylate transport system permease small subunit